MSSEELKDHLVDLLYDDELDDETRASMRREVEGSDEAREELEEFESMLGMIRESTSDEGPSESVHESIMAAAREQAQNTTRERAAATERAPRVPGDDEQQGLWSRISSHQVTQLALAACAILGAGFLFYLFNMQADESAAPGMASSQEAKFESASEQESGEVSLNEKEVAQAETEPAADEGLLDREADSNPRGYDRKAEGADESTASGPTDELRKAPKPAPRKKSLGDSVASAEKEAAEKPARAPRTAKAKKSSPKLDTSKDKFDPFAGEDEEAQNVFGSAESPRARSQRTRTGRSDGASSSDNSGVASSLGLGADDSMQQERRKPAASASGGAEADLAAPSQEAASPDDADQTAGTSIADVESAYRSGNNRLVVTRADDIINSGSAAGSSMSRALELKGFALRRMGQLQEADRTLARLQSEYPDYKSSTIQSARADIAGQLRDQREAKRRKRRPQKDDDIELQPETESMDAAPTESMEEAY